MTRTTSALRNWSATAGLATLLVIVLLALLAPVLAPSRPEDTFPNRAFAPPMRIHLRDSSSIRAPFVYRQVLDDRVERRFHEDRTGVLPLRWFAGGQFVSLDRGEPLLLLGGDGFGRDVLSRLLYGARMSLGVTLLGALGALLLGTAIGALAGSLSGRTDAVLMLVADFVLVLPGVYLVLLLRALLPLVLSTLELFWLMAVFFAVAAWPHVARGVRAIVAAERARDYAEAARAAGAGPLRLARHLLPAARGFLLIELVLLIPALLVAEATISFLGLGFPESTPSWGTMLQDAGNISGLLSAPWTLAPAGALFVVVLSVQLAGGTRASENYLFTLTQPMPSVAGASGAVVPR
jgi:peptide/nickel transport system permease protein